MHGSLWIQLQSDWMPALSLLSALSSLNEFLSARFMHSCSGAAQCALSKLSTQAYACQLTLYARSFVLSFSLALRLYERNTFLCFAACGDGVHLVSTQTNAGSSTRARFNAEKRSQRPNKYENSEIFDSQKNSKHFFLVLQNSCEKGKLQVASKANSSIWTDFAFNCAYHKNKYKFICEKWAWRTPHGAFNCTWKIRRGGGSSFLLLHWFLDVLLCFFFFFGQPKSSHNLALKWAYRYILYICIYICVYVCVYTYGYNKIAKFSAEKRAKKELAEQLRRRRKQKLKS